MPAAFGWKPEVWLGKTDSMVEMGEMIDYSRPGMALFSDHPNWPADACHSRVSGFANLARLTVTILS